MSNTNDDHFLDAARRAAPAFGLDPVEVTILQRSENVVCAITRSDGSKLAMRLHRPGYNTIGELQSEVAWVRALHDAGIPVPDAVATTEGDHYSPIDILIGDTMVEHHVGVVEWVDGAPLGAPLEGAHENIGNHFGRLGELAARVRLQSETWETPAGFERRRWDAEALVGDAPLWGRFWESPALSNEQREIVTAAAEALAAELGSWSTEPDRFGLIHADLHLGNVMADGDNLTLIDFDDAGFGWYAYELAVSLESIDDEPWFESARATLFDGYRRFHSLDSDEIKQVDTLMTTRTLITLGWLTARPELASYEQLPAIVDRAVTAAKAHLDRGPS